MSASALTSETCLVTPVGISHQFLLSRKKFKSDIKFSRSQIRKKFDKTYKHLTLQLDQDLGSFDAASAATTNRTKNEEQSPILVHHRHSENVSPIKSKASSVNQMKIMQDSRETMSELQSSMQFSGRQTASQTAFSSSSYATVIRQRRLKNDFISRMMLNKNTETFVGA